MHSWTIEYHELETRKRLAVRGATAIADIVGNSQGDE